MSVKERPIIFTHNIREIISGEKIQTRRVIKPQPFGHYSKIYFDESIQKWNFYHPVNASDHIRCPYGVKGDVLWVKEVWREKKDGSFEYKANGLSDLYVKWKSPLFMPKSASRTKLLVERVRVQRIQEILDDDCLAEGVKKVTKDGMRYKYCFYDKGDYSSTSWSQMHLSPKLVFEDLWNSINRKRGFGWDVNPFVWVVDFSLL